MPSRRSQRVNRAIMEIVAILNFVQGSNLYVTSDKLFDAIDKAHNLIQEFSGRPKVSKAFGEQVNRILEVSLNLIRIWQDHVASGGTKAQKLEAKNSTKLVAKKLPSGVVKIVSQRNRRLSTVPSVIPIENRERARQLLAAELLSEEGNKGCGSPIKLAKQLERVIHLNYKITLIRYNSNVRKCLAALRSQKNPYLKQNFIMGVIPPGFMNEKILDQMTKEHMQKVQKLVLEILQTGASMDKRKTTCMRCAECGRKKVRYSERMEDDGGRRLIYTIKCTGCNNTWNWRVPESYAWPDAVAVTEPTRRVTRSMSVASALHLAAVNVTEPAGRPKRRRSVAASL